jgi:uncharacterized protein YndB with AHSA1/START domain
MKIIKYFLLSIVIVFTSFSVWMMMIPEKHEVNREVVLSANRDTVFQIISDLTHFESWAAWFEGGPLELEVSNPSSGSGAFVRFNDADKTSGKFLITGWEAPNQITYQLEYNNEVAAKGTWIFEPIDDESSKMTWTYEGSMPFYFRWVNLTIDRRMGADLEKSMMRADSLFFNP